MSGLELPKITISLLLDLHEESEDEKVSARWVPQTSDQLNSKLWEQAEPVRPFRLIC